MIPAKKATDPENDNDDYMVNDSMGTTSRADTMDTEPDDDPELGGKGIGPRTAE